MLFNSVKAQPAVPGPQPLGMVIASFVLEAHGQPHLQSVRPGWASYMLWCFPDSLILFAKLHWHGLSESPVSASCICTDLNFTVDQLLLPSIWLCMRNRLQASLSSNLMPRSIELFLLLHRRAVENFSGYAVQFLASSVPSSIFPDGPPVLCVQINGCYNNLGIVDD